MVCKEQAGFAVEENGRSVQDFGFRNHAAADAGSKGGAKI